ncbi:predicted protein [Naegleria gruberi]|uniref:Predicted protein n=1 Tax=Naegleria gruberi TaxID=5762 RepID=D2VQD2_NAEGR|nr:uncharacterized protein NAEGRDRAFT_71184 [Naegleria gruberi]EFC40852.1 predicted protein [Naegleria gruberi]|eukprot:XP_002673596.1 predicted protein [Naegleria gruberi strain NEG-M]
MSSNLPCAEIILEACKKLSHILGSSFGPLAFHKLIINYHHHVFSDVIYSNDGATIMDSLPIVNPIGRILCDLSKSQEEQAGDGTTGVVLLCCELVRNCLEELHLKQLIPLDVICSNLSTLKNVCKETFLTIMQRDRVMMQQFVTNNCEIINFICKNSLQSKELRFHIEHFKSILTEGFSNGNSIPKHTKFHIIEGGQLNDSFGFNGIFMNISQSSFSKRYAYSSSYLDKLSKCRSILLLKRQNLEMNQKEKLFWRSLFELGTSSSGIIILMEGAFPFHDIFYSSDSNVLIFDKLSSKHLQNISHSLNLPSIIPVGSTTTVENEDLYIFESSPNFSIFQNEIFITIPNVCDFFNIIIRGPSNTINEESKRSIKDAFYVIKGFINENNFFSASNTSELCGGGCHIEMSIWRDVSNSSVLSKGISTIFADSFLSIVRFLLHSSGFKHDSEMIILRLASEYSKNPNSFFGIDLTNQDSQTPIISNIIEAHIIENLRVKKIMIELAIETAINLLRIKSIDFTN